MIEPLIILKIQILMGINVNLQILEKNLVLTKEQINPDAVSDN